MAGLQPPPPFLPHPGSPSMPWKQWEGLFQTYLLASGANKFNEDRRRALLLHCLGPEGQRIYVTLPSAAAADADGSGGDASSQTESFAETLRRLNMHFTPAINVVAERYRFRQRAQGPEETVEDYVMNLRALSITCKFENMNDEFIRDQLIEKTNSERIRERLLTEPSLTLQSALVIARQLESAVRDARSLDSRSSVCAVGYSKSKHSHKNTRKKNFSKQAHGESQALVCYRCGLKGHKANDVNCKAKNAKCSACQKEGHFARVCKSSAGSGTVNQLNSEETDALNQGRATTLQVLSISAPNIRPYKSTVQMNGANVVMDVDTGSPVSLLPVEIFDKFFLRDALLPPNPNVTLTTYLRNPIPVVGMFPTTVRHKQRTTESVLYIVTKGDTIMGRDIFDSLRPALVKEEVVMNVSSTEFPELFSDKVGLAKGYVHRVRTRTEVQPVQHKLRRLPFAIRDQVSAELKRLEDLDIIERVDASEWISALVVAHKKSGDVRLCVDLRDVNKAIVEDKFPIPNIQELISELRGATVFSTLDLTSAYHQLLLHEESRDLTTFITLEGLFRFKRVCFGLSSAPSAFQKLMSSVLQGLTGVQCYLDDVVVYGDTQDAHDCNLRAVLQQLQEVGLTLNTQKCHFSVQQIHFLGHVISREGLQPDESHVDAIRNAPVPTDVSALRSFLGLASYYSRFLPNVSTVTESLRVLTRKGVPFVWTPEADKAFNVIKDLIIHSVTLQLFDPALPVIVATDASAYGLGAVLLQVKDGSEVPVAFASRTLSNAERNYSVGEKEALACLWACEKWFQYIWGRHFVLRTDHQSLTTLLSCKGSGRQTMRIARWATRLMRFNYTVEYSPGVLNTAADALSRLPCSSSDAIVDDDEEVIIQCVNAIFASASVTKSELQQATATDSTLQRVISYVINGWSKDAYKDDAIKSFYMIRNELSLIDQCLFRGDRVVIPSACQSKLITVAHSAHQGIVRTKQRLRQEYWWPSIDRMVEDAIHHCSACQMSDKVARCHNTPLQSVELPSGPWEKLAIDITGPFKSHEYKYAVVVIDYYSKWPEVAFMSEVTSSSIIRFLTQLFAREGLPSEIVSDNGVQFVSTEFKQFLQRLNITHCKSSLYYPRANGEVERWNRVLKQTLQIATTEHKSWREATLELLMAYRATPHQTTGKSPAMLLHGRKMITPVNIRELVSENQAEVDSEVRERVSVKQAKSKAYTDKVRNAKVPTFQVGDMVRVKRHQKTGNSKYYPPQRIVGKKGPYTYVLEDNRVWNASKLTRCMYLTDQVSQSSSADAVQTKKMTREKRERRNPKWMKDFVSK